MLRSTAFIARFGVGPVITTVIQNSCMSNAADSVGADTDTRTGTYTDAPTDARTGSVAHAMGVLKTTQATISSPPGVR